MKFKSSRVEVHEGSVLDRLRVVNKVKVLPMHPFDTPGRSHIIHSMRVVGAKGKDLWILIVDNNKRMPMDALKAHPASQICIDGQRYEHFGNMMGERWADLIGKQIVVEEVVTYRHCKMYQLRVVHKK